MTPFKIAVLSMVPVITRHDLLIKWKFQNGSQYTIVYPCNTQNGLQHELQR